MLNFTDSFERGREADQEVGLSGGRVLMFLKPPKPQMTLGINIADEASQYIITVFKICVEDLILWHFSNCKKIFVKKKKFL